LISENYNICKKTISITFNKIKNNIISEIRAEFPTIASIILYGSYGRDEGGWFYENNKINPYNDFDLLLVFKEKYNGNTVINQFRKKLAKKLGIKWVDISIVSINNLKNTKNSIYGYDLKYGSSVIYGDSKVLDVIPVLSSKKIDLIEGEILFFTRLWAFSGSISEIKELDGNESRFFRNQMSKAVFAIIDTILLLNEKYHHSYIKRYEIVSQFFANIISPEILVIFKWALEEKLEPKEFHMSKEEVRVLYTDVAKIYKYFMLQLLNRKYKKTFHSIIEFKHFYKYNLKINIKRLAYILIRRSFKFETIYWTNIIHMNILSIILNEVNSEPLLKESVDIFKKLGYDISLELSEIKLKVSHIKENL